jgi:ketosteroid isomerase-like protein
MIYTKDTAMTQSPESLLATYEEQLAFQEFERVRPLIADDAVFWFNDGSHEGIASIEAAFAKTFALIQDEKYWLTDTVWLHKDDRAAAAIYTFNWSGVINGQKGAGSGRGTNILRKVDGLWKIVHEHLSRHP